MIKIDINQISELSESAKVTKRGRINFNFHKEPADLFQRMLNAIEPGSYVRPHKHENPDKREVFLILYGKMAVIEFDDEGEITDYVILDKERGNFAVEIPVKTWHVIISLEKGSVVYEVKDGPYEPLNDKNFAPWAPEEGSPAANIYLQDLVKKLGL